MSVKKLFPMQSVLAGGIATGVAVFMTGQDGIGGIADAVLGIGLPTIAGNDVAHLLNFDVGTNGGDEDIAAHAAVAGGVAVGILAAIGRIDTSQMGVVLPTFIIAGGSTFLARLIKPDSATQ